jgi:hypothetical protein
MGGSSATISASIVARDMASAVIRSWANTTRQATSQVNSAHAQLNNTLATTTKAASTAQTALQTYQQEQHRMGMSTGRLIVMMVKFGIILKALQIATAPLRIMSEGIKNLMTVDVGSREIMGMLATSTDTVSDKITRYNLLVGANIELQRKWGFTAADVGKGLYNVASVISTLNFAGYAASPAEAITKLTSDAATLARGGFMPLEEATGGLTTVFSALGLPLTDTAQVMDIMFNAVKIGKGHMSDLTANMGGFLAILGDITTETGRMQAFQETMGIFGYLTTIVSAPRAGTAVRRLLEGISDPSGPQGQLMKQVEDTFGINLSAAQFSTVGPNNYLTDLLGAVGPTSAKLSGFLEQRLGKPPTEEQMRAASTAILEKITGDKKAAIGLVSMARPGVLEDIMPVMAQRGSAAMAESEAMLAYQTKWERFTQNIAVVGETLQQNVLPQIMDFFGGVTSVLELTTKNQAYADAGTGGKVGMILKSINLAFGNWFTGANEAGPAGAGKNQISAYFETVGYNAAKTFMSAFGISLPGEVDKQSNYLFEAGGRIIGGMWKGVSDRVGEVFSVKGITGIIGDLANNPLARGAATFFGLIKTGIPWPIALMLSMSGAAAAGGTDLGPIGNPVAAAAGAIGVISLLRNVTSGARNWAVGNPAIANNGGGFVGNTMYAARGVRSGAQWLWNRVPNGAPPSGMFSTYPGYGYTRGPGGRIISGQPPGGMVGNMGYMTPPIMGEYSAFGGPTLSAQRTPSSFAPGRFQAPAFLGRMGRGVGRGVSAVRGSIGRMGAAGPGAGLGLLAMALGANGDEEAATAAGMGSGALMLTSMAPVLAIPLAIASVVMAIKQVADTIQLIRDNWEKFSFALRNNMLGDIPLFGAFFSFLKNIWSAVDAWNNAPWNIHSTVPPAGMQNSPTYQQVPAAIPIPAGVVPPGAGPQFLPQPGADPGKYKPVSLTMTFPNATLQMNKDQLQEYADMAYDAVVSRFSGESTNSGKTAQGLVAT